MKLTDLEIKEYQEIHFAEFGEKISDEEAERQIIRMLDLLKTIINNDNNEQSKSINK